MFGESTDWAVRKAARCIVTEERGCSKLIADDQEWILYGICAEQAAGHASWLRGELIRVHREDDPTEN